MLVVFLLLIVLPPIAFLVSLIALRFIGLDEDEAQEKWYRRAWVSGILSLGSVALVAYFISTFSFGTN
jgi:hypothetical protein